MFDISISQIKSIRTFPSLVKFLRDELNWPIEQNSFNELNEISFAYSADELGLKEKFASKIRNIRQLRPLVPNQPWGVFWIDFEPKHLPIGALRKVLNYFVHKKRTGQADRATWAMDDLLFIVGTGDNGHRGITFAHFHKNNEGNEELKEFSWEENETHFYYIIDYLDNLKWPKSESDHDKWREQWRRAFRGSTRKAIKTAEQLAIYMAELARDMRNRVKDALEVESQLGPLHVIFKNFSSALISDLNSDTFADMYAQTITYGLFSARCMDADGHFELPEVVDRLPDTNPFLKGLFKECFRAAKKSDNHMNFDELGINRLVELLDDLNQKDGSDRMQDILREFGRQTRQEDPIVHFYEGFLKAYEPKQRKIRGVYYTPDPVVSYIVRSVDELLRNEFGLKLGLADTSTWGELVANGRIKHPEGFSSDSSEWKNLSKKPFVQILDPATGTGTFLKHVILLIYETMVNKWEADGASKEKIKQLWNDYVPNCLLQRIHGFELMMAPYAVCHMKLGLVLRETGYEFKENYRLNVYLTNSLEPSEKESFPAGIEPYISEEVYNAICAKKSIYFTVIIGNPPYAGYSVNNGKWIEGLMEKYKTTVRIEERQIQRLSNDYVKFICLSEYLLLKSSVGVAALITDRGYLDGILFRDMRKALRHSFQNIRILDLHGVVMRGSENYPEDENIFDITQGVAISIFKRNCTTDGVIKYADIHGNKECKYKFLAEKTINNTEWRTVAPISPRWLFIPFVSNEDYEKWPLFIEIIGTGSVKNDRDVAYGTGIKTRHDDFVVGWNEKDAVACVKRIANRKETDKELLKSLNLCTTAHFSITSARKRANNKDLKTYVQRIAYRPYDWRWIVYLREFICEPKAETMKHMLSLNNIAMAVLRRDRKAYCTGFFVARGLIAKDIVSNLDDAIIWPLYLLPGKANIASAAIEKISRSTNLQWKAFGKGDLSQCFGPEDIFKYIYSILYSQKYRTKYAASLILDYPRIPLTPSLNLFKDLVHLGDELVATHLLESSKILEPIVNRFIGEGSAEVNAGYPRYSDGIIKINSNQGFKDVASNVWNYRIGTYQICDKWLRVRQGIKLTDEDLIHYNKILVAINETSHIMQNIDKVIEKYGSWPEAFKLNKGRQQ